MGGSRNKREERLQRAAHRKHRKDQRRKGDDDEGDFKSLRNQLEVHGLTLREVPGDGYVMLWRYATGEVRKHFHGGENFGS